MDATEHDNQAFTVSAVIPAYNIGKLVARAIDSVLAQIHQPDEIIVVDDGSTDDTAAVIQSYGSKVIYIYQENLGLAGARNTGIRAANCDWVAFLDGDDEWLPQHLQSQADLLQANKDLVWSCGNFDRCLCNENQRAPHLDPQKAAKLLAQKDYFEDFFDAFTAYAGPNGDTAIIKRQILHEAGLFHSGMPFAEDIDMWFRIAMRWPKVGYVPQPIAVYHLYRPGSLANETLVRKKMEIICDLVDRSLTLAEQHNRLDKFKPCASWYLRRCIRAYLFHAHMAPDIRNMLQRFEMLFAPSYKMLITLLTCFPRVTTTTLHMISRTVRFLNLRRRVVRRPRK
jgi:glycosyltransferase involved in cell wall biosynthesis